MGWERRGSGFYFYEKRRIGGRVVSRYLGNREWAVCAASLINQEHHDRQRQWAKERAAIAAAERSTAAAQAALLDLDRLASAAARAALTEAGYHEHRGQWRRRRDAKQEADQ